MTIINSEDFALVYSYLWDDIGLHPYINYKDEIGVFDNKIQTKKDMNPDNLKYAGEYLEKKWMKLYHQD
ncbi:hypothetical protein [Flavobacterium sp. 9]|uniref:hypothetical protein n=1 Tax=Flavobacterium sp. 9 TaxID=2035198 RepID=UPI000C1A3E94|nr:hypothetical protein [Flavobacterium sp. 9]